jgi:hypothetical protein
MISFVRSYCSGVAPAASITISTAISDLLRGWIAPPDPPPLRAGCASGSQISLINGKIAFERDDEIWTMNPNGSGAVPLTKRRAVVDKKDGVRGCEKVKRG